MTGELKEIAAPAASAGPLCADTAVTGRRFPPQQQLLLYSASDWEGFVQEWAHFCLKARYERVVRFSGSRDMGIDIAGFADSQELRGIWDNFQCKHYGRPLRPSDVLPEIGKCLYWSFRGEYRIPRRCFFVAPKGAGTDLSKVLSNPEELRKRVLERWDSAIRSKITEAREIPLVGDFRTYVQEFDFSIFAAKTGLELVEEHRRCPYHAQRFGGGLPARPDPGSPPEEIQRSESRYIAQLLEAYGDHKKQTFAGLAELRRMRSLYDHFLRQREAFYHAEQLRVFARDTVPRGTFESLQDDIYTGVIDVHDADHPDGYQRLCKVTEAARELQITANALITRTRPKDRDGICHQLANEDRLEWTKR